ncbi:MAG: hypothetical protein AAF709_19455 [Pseudomonadota bacterium]
MVINNDLPSMVAALATKDGIALSTAAASANGARLVETLRVDGFRELLKDVRWDAIVVQDFTKTPLWISDRWGSSWAIKEIANVSQRPIVLYPPFPAVAEHAVYRSTGPLITTPKDPADYAARTLAHYSRLAAREGVHLANVPEAWMTNATPDFYASDGLHPSNKGSAFIASILWPVIRTVLAEAP